jgi:hypothetical protein
LREADAGRTDLAALALHYGEAAFVKGEGPARVLVVQHEPTLDDMLAVLLLQERLAGRQPPPGAEAFARYTASLRQGVRPAEDVPVEESPEAFFAAIRQDAGDRLTEPAKAARFLAGWERMAAVLRPALAAGIDPHRQTPFAPGDLLQHERQFLRRDRDVYRRDVRRGRRWRLRLSDEPAPVAGLWLPRPRSALFKFWARTDPQTPGRLGYRFLVVTWEHGQWTFSTDPLDRRPIKGLADELQAAELKAAEAAGDPARARNDPWYDGRNHGHTIVGAPHGGSLLSDEQVLAIVHRWGGVRNLASPRRRLLLAAAALLIVLAVPAAIAALWPPRPPDPEQSPWRGEVAVGNFTPAVMERLQRGTAEPKVANKRVTFPPDGQDHTITLSPGTAGPLKLWFELPPSDKLPFRESSVQAPDREPVPLTFQRDESGLWRSQAVQATLPSEDSGVRLTFRGPTPGAKLTLRMSWQPNPEGVIHLHVLAVGVSRYAKPFEHGDLQFADADADALTRAFLAQRGPLFDEVRASAPLVNEQATRDGILTALEGLKKQVVEDRSALKLVVVVFSGHGAVAANKFFLFLPHDYGQNPASRGVTWRDLEIPLAQMNCPAVVVLDTCHSGQAAYEVASAGSKGSIQDDEVEEAVRGFAGQRSGLFVLAAALPRERAYEDKAWKHGALTLALLEALTGRSPYEPEKKIVCGPSPVVTLGDVQNYVSRRVAELTRKTDRQTVVPLSNTLNAALIPLALRANPKAPDRHE